MSIEDVKNVDLEKRARELAEDAERLRRQSDAPAGSDDKTSADLERALITLRQIARRA